MMGNRIPNELKGIQKNPSENWTVNVLNDLSWEVLIKCDVNIFKDR